MSANRLEQIPPQNLEAEQAALGAMLLERDAIMIACEMLVVEDFYREAHQVIYRGIQDIYRRNEPVDLITLGEWLKAHDKLEAVGGTMYLTTVIAQTPTAAGIAYYCNIVREKAMLRAAIKASDRLMQDCYDHGERTASEIITPYQTYFDRLQEGLQQHTGLQLHELEAQVIADMQQVDETGVANGISFGIPSLDRILDPMLPGDVIVLAGRPSTGKTVLAMNISRHAAALGHSVLVLSREMSGKALANRSLLAESGVSNDVSKMIELRKRNHDAVYGRFEAAMQRHTEWDIEIDRPRELKPETVQQKGKRKKHQGGLHLVMIDYLQLMQANDRYRDDYERISAISREVKEVAIALNVPIILVAQLSREVEKRTPKRPMMSDLRGSGGIEQDADAILLLYRPGYYDADNFAENRRQGLAVGDKNSTEIIVGKQRNGKTGSTWVHFDLERSRFTELEKQREEGR